MTDFIIFSDNDMKGLERKIKFYFRENKDKWIVNIDLSSTLNPFTKEFTHYAAVVYDVNNGETYE